MTKPFQKAMLITSVIYLVIGLILILWPDVAGKIIIYAIGAAALLYGGFRIVDFFVRKEHLSGTVQLGVALGIGSLLLGLFLMIKVAIVVALLAAIIGVAVIVDSVLRLQIALNLRHVGGKYWVMLLVTALVTLGFGILLLFNPFTAVRVATIVAGVFLLIDGGFTLFGVLQAQSGGPQRTVTIK
ncbi:MAG TPA: DUF308 domain-containing protein [Clostridia bacterium]|nr:DUF308 domain-containing protein [Clostridia bacterium]